MLDHLDKPESGSELPELPRVELLKIAQSLHVSDADVMTRAELRAAIDKARRPEPAPRTQPVTWVSVARRLLASIVEQGLHLPDAAALIRGDTTLSAPPKAPPPVATVTLARIYAAQGHLSRAIATLDEVLATDPDHDLARELQEQLRARQQEERASAVQSSLPPSSRTDGEPDAAAAASADGRAENPASEPLAAQGSAHATESSSPAPSPAPQPLQPAGTEAEGSVAAPASAPPEEQVTAATSEPAPRSVAPLSEPASRPMPRELPAPRPPELILIETGDHETYLYWELERPPQRPSNEPHWISVVAHTPTHGGCERHERRFPVQHESGALRLHGLPRRAVLRAKLSCTPSPSAPPLVVASCVRTASTRPALLLSAEPRAEAAFRDAAFEPRFTPHSRVSPAALARRAADHLETANAAYW